MNQRSFDGRQTYVWLTKPWISFWFVHGPDRYNIYTFGFINRESGDKTKYGTLCGCKL